MSALDKQIGGDHYKNFKIQPVEFSTINNLGFLAGCIVKRICRYQSQEDPIKDLQKIKHEVDLIMEIQEGMDPRDLDCKGYEGHSTIIEDAIGNSNPVIIDTGNFIFDLYQLISTQDKWSKEELLTVIRALKKNKYSK